MIPAKKFQLETARWYPAHLLGPEFGPDDGHAFSPIQIKDVRPLKTGKGLLELSFFHHNYPEGVQDKNYRLRIITHESTFIFAVREGMSGDVRYLLITDLSWLWLGKHYGLRSAHGEDVQQWLRSYG